MQSTSHNIPNSDGQEEQKPSMQSTYQNEERKPLWQHSDQQDTNKWAMFLHLSQFAGYVIPLAGMIVPIAIWFAKKEEMPELDAHGKMVANWLITELIFGAALFMFGLVGMILFPLLLCLLPIAIGLGIAGVAFPIFGAIKASNGELWPYPLTIQFLK